MIDLNASLSRGDVAKFRTLLSANRSMAAKALTFTAEKAQGDWRHENHRVFHMRRRWLDMGVRIKHATPSHLAAKVGSIDTFFGRHVKGVDEPKRSGKKSLFVPVQPASEQGTHTQIRSRLRRMERTKTKPFMRGGVLLRRIGRAKRQALTVLAVLRKEVDIKPRFDAVGVTERAVRREFSTIYERLLLKWAASA